MVKQLDYRDVSYDQNVFKHPIMTMEKSSSNNVWVFDFNDTLNLLSNFQFSAERFREEDGSITLSLNEIDLVENGVDDEEARLNLGQEILDYAKDYFDFFYDAKNRVSHLPYVIKALTINDSRIIGGMIQCQDGQN